MQLFQRAWPYFLLLLVLNLVQSYCSELAHDEAYYWVYSQHLDWGYFDHPPAIAVLVALGYTLLENEMGVRLFVLLANLLTIFLMYRMLKPTQVPLFSLLLFGAVISHVGFLAVPDVPLLLSVAAFFYFYQQYVHSYDWKNALWLGLVIALMGYSKYHGIVILVSVLLSNLSLLRQKTFYLAITLAAMLYTPHLYWQYSHDFPTFRFHLFDRSAEAYSFSFMGEYLLGQLLVFGPLMGFLLFGAAYRFSAKDTFERALRFTFFGVFGFFLLSSLKGRVEPNWTAMGMVPLLYMAYHYIEQRRPWIQWTYRLAIPSFVVIVAFRFILMVEVLPQKWFPLGSEFHGWKSWATTLHTLVGDKPALFFNSYQRAAKYSFYSLGQGFSINTVSYAGSQYDLLLAEQEKLQGQQVGLIHLLPREAGKPLVGGKDHIYVEMVDGFYFYNRLTIKLFDAPVKLLPGQSTEVNIELCNTTNRTIPLRGNKNKSLAVGYVIFELKNEVARSATRQIISEKEIKAGECLPMRIPLSASERAGTYRYRMSIFNGQYEERNDHFHKLEVSE
jgi:Dolichyl-phosphate-mannose-protein mannosyltransferase